ncbi:hypothetical protein TREMEDRAFT_59492 [Tremella mesenterica DSM 1558]|uniref:uncharacterized protein n=1 Tax=Tremella mesenterica (strain ATCC 24925 / CBS 8224 / DSM 1558 / NBRC 9311 / NRRL Y-6157 / RJB 2259-6 / UBC 559-6) TaxID=578456 RepID=UPI0003F49F1C|nr:uncharacterized protein TREMEDRAFT_59492 [Tremella mesenterica DSM 1558]EIW73328.1 hypothetical protein TREMEDRAFT_59492 [Tremella mesenterica DSM 1558]
MSLQAQNLTIFPTFTLAINSKWSKKECNKNMVTIINSTIADPNTVCVTSFTGRDGLHINNAFQVDIRNISTGRPIVWTERFPTLSQTSYREITEHQYQMEKSLLKAYSQCLTANFKTMMENRNNQSLPPQDTPGDSQLSAPTSHTVVNHAFAMMLQVKDYKYGFLPFQLTESELTYEIYDDGTAEEEWRLSPSTKSGDGV